MHRSLTQPGEVVELEMRERDLSAHDTTTLVRTDDFRIIQTHLPAGSKIPTYEAHGQIVLHCLDGHVSVFALGQPHVLKAGQLLYLVVNEPFSIVALSDSSIIATIITPTSRRRTDLIGQ
jgi:quercetin dioxygenase-like cupin family protein